MTKIFSVAIDGPAGAGKSTIARAVAKKYGVLYLDTGAMYRACAIWLCDRGVDVEKREDVAQKASQISIDVRFISGVQHMFIEDKDITARIRTPEVSMLASAVSKYPEIRARMVDMQKDIARGTSVVMDGRDIGTKVLPNATIKIFLIAKPEIRAERRLLELREKGADARYEDVLSDIVKRDLQDSTRACSPLEKACDAVTLDTTSLTLEQSILSALSIVAKGLSALEGDCE